MFGDLLLHDADRIYVVPKFVRKSTLKMFFFRSIKVYL